MMNIDSELLKKAYKKLKSSIYYDRTQLILRDKLVRFEKNLDDIDKYFDELAEIISDETEREELISNILSSIKYSAFPKGFVKDEGGLIKNYHSKNIELDKDVQYFIDMRVEGHILGVLWLMLIGYRIDNMVYEHSYGNRLRKNLYNEFSNEPTYSPYLFEPYFQQYESWRDMAMDEAASHLKMGQDVVILTMDFRRFYYSVDVTDEFMMDIFNNATEEGEENNALLFILNDIIYDIIKQYSSLFDEFEGRNILPIGFLPSNVLANWALRNFDKAILDGWNPIYFGRYVDDVLIVDKVEHNSDLCKKAKDNDLKEEDIKAFFLEQCSGWKGVNGIQCKNNRQYALLKKSIDKENHEEYVLNSLYNPVDGDNSRIVVKNEKVSLFYFRSNESDALLTCFRENIAKNKSEFRHMPEDEMVFQKDDYSEIYDLKNEESLNKFRGIKGIDIDKFELSKLLGKHLRIGGMIEDCKERSLNKQILKIFNPKVTIENYGVWEKVIEILVINEDFDTLEKFIKRIIESIDMLSCKDTEKVPTVQNSLKDYLKSALCRPLGLVWGENVDEFIENVCTDYLQLPHQSVNIRRKAYCKTKMIDKSVMPIFIDMLKMSKVYDNSLDINLTKFDQVLKICKKSWKSEYIFYPYLLTMYDFSMISCIEELYKSKGAFSFPEEMYTEQVKNYIKNNYSLDKKYILEMNKRIDVRAFGMINESNVKSYVISVGNEKKDKLRLAIANVRLNHDNFERLVKDSPNRNYNRYKNISKIINAAIDEHADMIIMPEAFVPFEWLTTIARTCANNKLALITGVEHVKIKDKVYNLTAVILPYEDLYSRSAYISFHLKTHYAPAEKQEINGYRLKEISGDHYELYKWLDCYFPVYCCYELTSIFDRALFQSYADFLVAIEWNKDVNYYSNILESLSRDIHCYCVQVNSSDYGDSRITKPSKTEVKDILRTKGGINSTILVDDIDIKKLRDFQLKGYDLQCMDKSFKTTPPGFEPQIVLKKIKGESLL